MPVTPALVARRALVKVLLALAALYALSLNLSRESTDEQVTKAYKRVALKVHPDKGGTVEHAQQLNLAKEAWEKAKKKAKGPGGRAREQPGQPGPAPAPCDLADPAEARIG